MRKEISILMVGHDRDTEMLFNIHLNQRFSSLYFKTVQSGLAAVEACKEYNFDFVFVEFYLPDMGGIPLILEIKDTNPDTKGIVYTSWVFEINDYFRNNNNSNSIGKMLKPSSREEIDRIMNSFVNQNKKVEHAVV